MAGALAGLPAGIRLSDHISLGVIARAFPPERVQQILAETGKASERERDLPAQVMVYYAIALALYMGSSTREVLRCRLEGLRWLCSCSISSRRAGAIKMCLSATARHLSIAGWPGTLSALRQLLSSQKMLCCSNYPWAQIRLR